VQRLLKPRRAALKRVYAPNEFNRLAPVGVAAFDVAMRNMTENS